MCNWISRELNWDKPAIDNQKLDKELVFDLINAKNAKTSKDAFWKLDGLVCKNGGLSESSINVTICILASLPNCSYHAKLKCVDLLIEIISSVPVLPNSLVLDECLEEIYTNSWFFLNSLEFSEPENIYIYVDLICILSVKKVKFAKKAIIYLYKILDMKVMPKINLMVLKNSIAEIEEILKV